MADFVVGAIEVAVGGIVGGVVRFVVGDVVGGEAGVVGAVGVVSNVEETGAVEIVVAELVVYTLPLIYYPPQKGWFLVWIDFNFLGG